MHFDARKSEHRQRCQQLHKQPADSTILQLILRLYCYLLNSESPALNIRSQCLCATGALEVDRSHR